jgi:hypothetical protein
MQRMKEDLAQRSSIPQPTLEAWRMVSDETDTLLGQSREVPTALVLNPKP